MLSNSSKRQLLQRFLSDASLYGIVVVFSRFGWILLLPIFWRFLTPDDYGIIGIIQLTQGFLVPVLSLGLHDAVQRFYPEWSIDERGEQLGVISLSLFVWSTLICLFLSIGHNIFNVFFDTVEAIPYFIFAIWTAFFSTTTVVPLALFRIRGDLKHFSYTTAGMFLTQSALSLLFVSVFSGGAIGYLWGCLISTALWGIGLLIVCRHEAVLLWRPERLRPILAYSLPMIPATILDGTISLFDRFFLDKHVSLSNIGLYNVAQQFGSAVNVFNQSMKSAWFPFLFRVVTERKDAPEIVARFSLYYVAILLPPFLFVALLSKELILMFGVERYVGCYAFVPWVVLTIYFQSVTSAMGRGLDLAKKNNLWPVISAVQVIVSLLALAYFVPKYGAIGAAWAVAMAAGVRTVVQTSLGHYVFRRPFYGVRLIFIWATAAATFFIGNNLELEGLFLNAAAKTVVVLIGCAIIAAAVINRDALSEIRKLLWR